MIKLTGQTKDGQPLVVLYLNREDRELLEKGENITFDGAWISIPGVLFSIHGGETDESIMQTVKGQFEASVDELAGLGGSDADRNHAQEPSGDGAHQDRSGDAEE